MLRKSAWVWIMLVMAGVTAVPEQSYGRELPETWTFLMYAHGDHNLSAATVAEMVDMQKVGSAPGFNIVVQGDFLARDPETSQFMKERFTVRGSRWLIQQFDAPFLVNIPIQRIAEPNSDQVRVLADFITWGFKRFPAQRRAVVLMDHGGGWRGFGGDQQDGLKKNPGIMTVGEIGTAIRRGLRGAGQDEVDFIGFDACLMAAPEVLAPLKGLAAMVIATPEIDFGAGWDFKRTLGQLKRNPGLSLRKFAEREVEIYRDHHQSISDILYGAQSAFDMDRFPECEKAIRKVVPFLIREDSLEIARVRRQSTEYLFSQFEAFAAPSSFVDIGEFLRRLSQSPKVSRRLADASRRAWRSVREMTVAKIAAPLRKRGEGLNVWYPVQGGAADGYGRTQFAEETGWDRFLESVASVAAKSPVPRLSTPRPERISVRKGRPLRVDFSVLSRNAFALRSALLGLRGEWVRYLGELPATEVEGVGRAALQWDGQLPAAIAPDGSSVFFGGILQSVKEPIYLAYVSITEPGAKSRIGQVVYYRSGSEVGILSFLEQAEGLETFRGANLLPGTVITPLFYEERRRGNRVLGTRLGVGEQSVVVGKEGKVAMRLTGVPRGEYLIGSELEDLYGQSGDARVIRLSVR